MSYKSNDVFSRGLVVVNFMTGDASCPYWTELAVVKYDEHSTYSKIDCALRDFEPENDDYDYSDIVAGALTLSGLEWEPLAANQKIIVDNVFVYFL